MQATMWGGAGEHGRSCYLIEHRETRILLDCGVKKEQGGIYPECDEDIVRELDAVFLSHAHEDHSMALPLLYRMGYKGQVWTTRATHRQLPAYFAAWKQYVASQQAELPYEDKHIDAITYAFIEEAVRPGEWLELSAKLSVCWGRSGHLAGSIWLLFDLEGERVFYSGDYTAESELLRADEPCQLLQQTGADQLASPELAIVEAAYGTDCETQEVLLEHLQLQLIDALHDGKAVLMPVPTYGRGQDMMVWAMETFPSAAIIVEQELMTALGQLLEWREWLRSDAVSRIERFMGSPQVIVVENEAERRAAMSGEARSCLIFTSDSMMQSLKCRSYYELLRQRGNYAVILSGHLAQGSFGDQLLQAEQGKEREQRAVYFHRYKVHQGRPDVSHMLSKVRSRHTVLVHTGRSKTDALAAQLGNEGIAGLHSLSTGDFIMCS